MSNNPASQLTHTGAGPKNRTHYLYLAVIVAVALGVLVCLLYTSDAADE